MLMYNILSSQKDKLKFLNKSDENIDIVINQIREFKKHNINKEQLKRFIDNLKNEYLKLKLTDMYTLYCKYEEEINGKYIDEEDVLTILATNLEKTDMFKDTILYIDEFVGYTVQEYEIIKKLLKIAKQVNITVCTDILEQSKNRQTDHFVANKETLVKLIDIAKKEKIKIENPIKCEKLKKFKSEELIHLEKNLYNIKYNKYDKEPKNLKLFLAKNQFSEIENIAKEIIKLVRDNGYRYNEIAIITKNIDTYSSIAKAILGKYDIPVYIDEKRDLSQNILIKYVLSVIEIFSKNWSYDTVFNYLKTGLTNIKIEEVFLLENYCIKYGIRGNKWYKEPWKIASSVEELEKLNELRQKIVEPLLKFKENLNRIKKANEISKVIYEFLIQNNINETIINRANLLKKMGELELADSYKNSWNILISLLDEIVLVLGQDKISFEEYAKTLKMGLQNSGLGNIPQGLDQVIIGDVDRSRTHKVKVAFIIGLNDGVFPSTRKEEGFLNDNDRNYLKENGIELAKGTKDLVFEENFNIYKAFLVPEESLYLSYSSSDNTGKALRQSIIISKIKNIFPKLEEKSDMIVKDTTITTKKATFYELLENIRKYQDEEEINDIWFEIYNIYIKDIKYNKILENLEKGLNYIINPEKLTKENVDKLYGNVLNTSISRLEQYKKCAFSYYLKYGLEISSKSLFKLESLDTGSFMHEVIDEFFNQVQERDIKLSEITDERIAEIITSIINEKLTLNRNYIFTQTNKYKILTKRLKKLILQSMKYIIQTITKSDFEIFGNEVEFKENKKYKPIVLEVEEGKKVEIVGKIDRIDIAKNKDRKISSYYRL